MKQLQINLSNTEWGYGFGIILSKNRNSPNHLNTTFQMEYLKENSWHLGWRLISMNNTT